MYSKKKENRLINLFKRDNDLGFPYHKSNDKPEKRTRFIKQLIANCEFEDIQKQNEKKFAEPWRKILKEMNTFDYITLVLITLAAGGFGYMSSINSKSESKIINQHRNAFIALFTLLGLLAGLGISLVNTVETHHANKQSDVENFYNRLIVRLFDMLREMYPDLDESTLKQCNPEMARVITTIMIANMPEKDIRTIQNIAVRMTQKLRNMDNKNKITTLSNYNSELKNALSIVEHNLLTNPTLNETILSVYRGNVPATFKLEKTR